MVLDSGLGGLTVVRALHAAAPGEQIVYFGDTARLPYGSKTGTTVTGFVEQIVSYLCRWNPKHIVIACNTASALALSAVRARFPGLSITGVLEPGAKAAVVAAGPRQIPLIGVIATEATIGSKAYERAIYRRRSHARLLLQATPLLVPMIEEGRDENDALVRLALKQYLHSLMQHQLDVLVLGCTHYPVYKNLIRRIIGQHLPVIDSAEQCADDVRRRLRGAGLLCEGGAASGRASRPWLRCFVTDDPVRFQRLAPRFLGVEIERPGWVAPEELYALPSPAVLGVPA